MSLLLIFGVCLAICIGIALWLISVVDRRDAQSRDRAAWIASMTPAQRMDAARRWASPAQRMDSDRRWALQDYPILVGAALRYGPSEDCVRYGEGRLCRRLDPDERVWLLGPQACGPLPLRIRNDAEYDVLVVACLRFERFDERVAYAEHGLRRRLLPDERAFVANALT